MKDYYTLLHLVEEFQILKDFVVVECFTQERNSLFVEFYNGERLQTLQFSCETGLESVFLRRNFERARMNSVDLLPEIIGAKCKEVRLFGNERIIVFDFGELELWFVLFGGAKTNAYVIDRTGRIRNSFLNPGVYVGENTDTILKVKANQEITTIQDYLHRTKYFTKEIAELLCKRIKLDCSSRFQELTPSEFEMVEESAKQMATELALANEYYVFFNDHKYFVSMIFLDEFQFVKKFTSISEAIYFCYVKSISYLRAKEKYKEIEKKLSNEYKYLKSKIENLNQQEKFERRVEEYQKFADLLLSQQNLSMKGLTTIKLVDYDGAEIQIPLKPELNLKQNAEYYYQKAKKLKSSLSASRTNIEETIRRFAKLEQAFQSLKSLDNYLKINGFEKEFSDVLLNIEKTSTAEEFISRFRRFNLGEGAVLFVGKNAKNNEELTFGFAKPNDFWFHARNVGGSHCVLKYSKGKEPPMEIIEKSAQIAAYFSKARNSDFVPVSYTQRKNIRKPRRGEKGTVILMRESVVFVQPKKPDEQKDN